MDDEDLNTDQLTPFQLFLVKEYLGLAQKLGLEAWRRACVSPLPSLPDPEKYEFVGVAYGGLIQAAQGFDPDWRPANDDGRYDPVKGFAARARMRITGAIKDWQRKLDHLPKRQRKIYRDMESKGYGKGRSVEELAAMMGISPEKIRAVIKAAEENSLALDAMFENEDSDSDLHDYISLPQRGVEDSAVVSSAQDAAADALASFTQTQRHVVVLRYYEGYDFNKISMVLQVSPTVVRTLHQEAMSILHDRIRGAAS